LSRCNCPVPILHAHRVERGPDQPLPGGDRHRLLACTARAPSRVRPQWLSRARPPVGPGSISVGWTPLGRTGSLVHSQDGPAPRWEASRHSLSFFALLVLDPIYLLSGEVSPLAFPVLPTKPPFTAGPQRPGQFADCQRRPASSKPTDGAGAPGAPAGHHCTPTDPATRRCTSNGLSCSGDLHHVSGCEVCGRSVG